MDKKKIKDKVREVVFMAIVISITVGLPILWFSRALH